MMRKKTFQLQNIRTVLDEKIRFNKEMTLRNTHIRVCDLCIFINCNSDISFHWFQFSLRQILTLYTASFFSLVCEFSKVSTLITLDKYACITTCRYFGFRSLRGQELNTMVEVTIEM